MPTGGVLFSTERGILDRMPTMRISFFYAKYFAYFEFDTFFYFCCSAFQADFQEITFSIGR